MSFPTETVTQSGSGLVFQNYYGDGVTDAYRAAILTAEHDFQSHFTNPVNVVMSFDLQSMDNAFAAGNTFNIVHVSYDTFGQALKDHATSADDQLAIAGLPSSDPSHGVGFNLTAPEARILGLAQQTFSIDNAVVLNSNLHFTFGQDAVATIEHEMSEGVFGRIASMGLDGASWEPMDLFRFNAAGVRDYTGGADGQTSYFGVDGSHLSSMQFHNALNTAGVSDGFDLADWENGVGDAFGADGANKAATLSGTDIKELDVIGWTPASAGVAASPTLGTTITATADSTHLQGGSGDDTLIGASVADSLRGGDGADSISGGSAFDDINGNAGADTIHGNGGDDWVVGGKDNDVLFGDSGADIVWGNLGNDTLDGGDGNDQVRGGQGDDSLTGGAGADFISGDRGNDTEVGGAGADTFHFSQDAGVDRVTDFNYAEGDRVQLDGGTTYSLHQIGADTVIDTGAGNEMVLVGVKLSTLPSDWIFGA